MSDKTSSNHLPVNPRRTSFASSASGSECGSGPSMSAPASSDSSSTTTSVKYETFVRHQGNEFVKKIEALIHNERESRKTHRYQPVKEFMDNTNVCDMFLVVGAPPKKHSISPKTERPSQGSCPGTPKNVRSTSSFTPRNSVGLSQSVRNTFSFTKMTSSTPPPSQISIVSEKNSAPSPFTKLSGMFSLKSISDSISSSSWSFRSDNGMRKTRARSYSTGEYSDIFHPKVLFKYPIDKEVDINGIAYMCFPDGAVPQRIVEKRFGKNVVLEDHKHLENSFVFLVTGNAEIRYGICVYKEVVAYQTESQVYIQPLCFCIISSLPFFQFHVNSLMSMLDMEGIVDLHLIPQDKLKELLKDVIDASLSQADAPQCDDPEYLSSSSSSSSPSSSTSSPLKQQKQDKNESKINEINNDNKKVEIEIDDDDDDDKSENEDDENIDIDKDDIEISVNINNCGGDEPPNDSPEDVEYKKILLSIVRYCNLKLPPGKAPLVYFNITMSSVNKYIFTI